MNDKLDGYEAHMMNDKSVYVEDPIHEYWRMREEQMLLALERKLAEPMPPLSVIEAAYRAGDRPFSIF